MNIRNYINTATKHENTPNTKNLFLSESFRLWAVKNLYSFGMYSCQSEYNASENIPDFLSYGQHLKKENIFFCLDELKSTGIISTILYF